MNSFEIYSNYRAKYRAGKMDNSKTREYAGDVLKVLWQETCDNEIRFVDIEFVSCILKMISGYKSSGEIDDSRISVLDAGIFIDALGKCILKGKLYFAIDNQDMKSVFRSVDLNRKASQNILNVVQKKLDYILEQLGESDQSIVFESNQNEEPNELKNSDYTQDIISDAKNDDKQSNLNHCFSNNVTEIEKSETESADILPSEIKMLDSNTYAEKIAVRYEKNKQMVDKWHDEIAELNETLKKIQPDVKRILENIMSFSDTITEKYVIQFAKMQIELFNIISDNLDYHCPKSEMSGDKDYVNAVENYKEFLDVIIDSLAIFGIETIVSGEGDLFDGEIHECELKVFSSKNAMLKKGLRAGFRYKDIVIQKEKVELKENEK